MGADANAVDASGERLKVELSDVLDLEDDVGGEIVALDSLIVDLAIRPMDAVTELFVLRRVHALG